ncbi:MAG: DUF2141 domain-containing protein [Parasphingorhabdus sp.]|uniref:DUF2141 domain-containing protein n=1 Tax=Parasphingorhabdus sp. TaxID=2709688 RepID=UPI003002C1CB
MKYLYLMVAAATPLLLAAQNVPSSPDLGKAEGRCRGGESGPAIKVSVTGLKDRKGKLKLEVYPSNDNDFLEDDNKLINAGKTFRRVEVSVPNSGTPQLCIRVPSAGSYSLSLLHDRDSNRKFGLSVDGIGFSSNPKLGWSKPKAAATRITAGSGVTRTTIVMNYRRGLTSFRPLKN